MVVQGKGSVNHPEAAVLQYFLLTSVLWMPKRAQENATDAIIMGFEHRSWSSNNTRQAVVLQDGSDSSHATSHAFVCETGSSSTYVDLGVIQISVQSSTGSLDTVERRVLHLIPNVAVIC